MKKHLLNVVLSVFVGVGLVILSGLFIDLGNYAPVPFFVGGLGFYGYKSGLFKKK